MRIVVNPFIEKTGNGFFFYFFEKITIFSKKFEKYEGLNYLFLQLS